jgi:SAM-dependent methyltransferase
LLHSFPTRRSSDLPVYLVGMFLICMFCHGEVAASRPGVSHLTGFYLAVSAGGVAGALLVAVVAPLALSGHFELGIGLIACAAFALVRGMRLAWWVRLAFGPVLVAVALLVASQIKDYGANATLAVRDFYGAFRVISTPAGEGTLHELRHGRILHGDQFVEPAEKRAIPLTYYSSASGLGIVLNALRPETKRRIGMVGLGAGTLAAYGKVGDVIRFYEIDPLVVRIAKTEFHYLGGTPAQTEVALGDARLSLEREAPQRFDVLAVDAFSGDAIPVHLLSIEAIELYLRHLKPDGVLLFHVTNRYLDLAPVLGRIAAIKHLSAALISHEPTDDEETLQYASSDWVVLSRDDAILARPSVAAAARPLTVPEGTPLWTDDFNNLLHVLR